MKKKKRERERKERGIFLFTIFLGNEVKSSLADFTLMAWHGSGRRVRGKGGREETVNSRGVQYKKVTKKRWGKDGN